MSLNEIISAAEAAIAALDADEQRWADTFDEHGDMTTDEYEERDDTRAQHVDSLALALRDLIEAVKSAPKPWAICQGGLIQDSSDGVETVDLDWMEEGRVADQEEAEGSWRLLTRIVNHEGRDGWGGDLHEVEEMLTTYYGDNDVPEEERVWA